MKFQIYGIRELIAASETTTYDLFSCQQCLAAPAVQPLTGYRVMPDASLRAEALMASLPTLDNFRT